MTTIKILIGQPDVLSRASSDSRAISNDIADEAVRRLARLIGRQIARDQFRRACQSGKKDQPPTESNR